MHLFYGGEKNSEAIKIPPVAHKKSASRYKTSNGFSGVFPFHFGAFWAQ